VRSCRNCSVSASFRRNWAANALNQWDVSAFEAWAKRAVIPKVWLMSVPRRSIDGDERLLWVDSEPKFFEPRTSPLGGKHAYMSRRGKDRSPRHSGDSIAGAK
jgi:hypothetical protein